MGRVIQRLGLSKTYGHLQNDLKPCAISDMLLKKIISGGQTGVDRGAIMAAKELGFPYGGLIPKGRLSEDGKVPDEFDKMEESTRKDYLFRTEWNVVHSDVTLIIAPYDDEHPDGQSALSGGTKKTYAFAKKHNKPCAILFNMRSQCCDIVSTLCWLKREKETNGFKDGLVLNVAGPRESKRKGVQELTRKYICELIKAARTVNEDELDWRLPEYEE